MTVLLVNGDPIAEISPPVQSRSTGNKVRGAIMSDFLLLPAKSKISVRVGEHFYGQAFL